MSKVILALVGILMGCLLGLLGLLGLLALLSADLGGREYHAPNEVSVQP